MEEDVDVENVERAKKKIKKSKKTRRKKHHKKRTRRKRRGGNRNSRHTRRARERGVNIMPTIREPRVWKVKENKTTGNNIMRKHFKNARGNN